MLEFKRRVENGQPTATLTLPLEKRLRSRQRATLDDGADAGIFLPRGQTLRHGDLLASDDGTVVRICAAPEVLSEVRVDDPLLLARACYHLGNRHVALQIGAGRLCYLHDHVLDELLQGLGLQPTCIEAPFEPEPGAYGGHSHAQGPHGHGH